MGKALLVPIYGSLSTELYVSEFPYMFRKAAGQTVLFVCVTRDVGIQMETLEAEEFCLNILCERCSLALCMGITSSSSYAKREACSIKATNYWNVLKKCVNAQNMCVTFNAYVIS